MDGASGPDSLFEALTLILDTEPHSAPINMAVDEVLLEQACKPLLRWYRWARPALSFGYFGRYEELAPQAESRELVRRWTGGGTVQHGEDFTFSLIVPRPQPAAQLPAAEAYRQIHAAVAFALGNSALAAAAAPKISTACFENPAASDVLQEGRKVAGGAQRRTPTGLLHQGSIQRPGLGEAFAQTLSGLLSAAFKIEPLRPATLSAAHDLAQRKYASDAWLRRY